jgi:hypothetical protein
MVMLFTYLFIEAQRTTSKFFKVKRSWLQQGTWQYGMKPEPKTHSSGKSSNLSNELDDLGLRVYHPDFVSVNDTPHHPSGKIHPCLNRPGKSSFDGS